MASLEPAALFQHPAVQYIPIGVEELWFSPSPVPSTGGHISMTVSELPSGPDGYIHFIVHGARVMQCHYRAHQAILVGQPQPGYTQSFRLTARYFYKPLVSFDLFDWEARPLATVSARVK